MKKLVWMFVASAFMFQACEGPVGPPGPAGEDGLIGEVLEVKASFNAANKFAADFDIKPAMPATDKLIGFILEGEDNQGNDNWEPLPQTFFENGGTYVYTFNFSQTGFTIFMDGNGNLANIPANKRTDRIFRMVIIPAAIYNTVDTSDMKAVLAAMQVNEATIKSDIQQLN
jgi:hypothetical protein